MNVELLEKVKQAIVENSDSFDMDEGAFLCDAVAVSEIHPCFTEACIAGWAVFLTEGKVPTQSWSLHYDDDGKEEEGIKERAQRMLGLTRHEADRLFLLEGQTFNDNHWPRKFENRLIRGGLRKGVVLTPEQRKNNAAVAIERIDHFIKTGGAE